MTLTQLEDFTQIKLPTVYYHLEKMEAAGLITGHRDKQGSRPEKTVYQVHGAGADKFRELLLQTLQIEYRPTLDIDGTLYFPDALEEGALADRLRRHTARLKQILSGLVAHRQGTLDHIPEAYRTSADIIFSHHIHHYQAELDWAEQSLHRLKEDNTNG